MLSVTVTTLSTQTGLLPTGSRFSAGRRAIACFDQAMNDVGIAYDDPHWRALHDYFAWATTTTMARYHHSADDVPDGMDVPKWSWDGLIRAETEALRKAYAALNRNDIPGFAKIFDPQIERIEPDDSRAAGPITGSKP